MIWSIFVIYLLYSIFKGQAFLKQELQQAEDHYKVFVLLSFKVRF